MNIISIPALGVTVQASSARLTVVALVNTLSARSPLVCDLIYSYMAQDYLPSHPNSSNHVVAKSRSAWNNEGFAKTKDKATGIEKPVNCLSQLDNGWFIYTQMNSRGFASTLLSRIEEALQSRSGVHVKIYALLDATSDLGPGVRHYTMQDVELLSR
jgi:hypothetical protein